MPPKVSAENAAFRPRFELNDATFQFNQIYKSSHPELYAPPLEAARRRWQRRRRGAAGGRCRRAVMSAVERLIAHRIRALLATLCVPRIQDRSKHVQEPKTHFREVTVRTLRDRGFHDRAVHPGMIQ